jgi:hypothetical protein
MPPATQHPSNINWNTRNRQIQDGARFLLAPRLQTKPSRLSETQPNGYFQDPYSETMAEALLKAQGGGAVAIWTSSGLTEPDQQAVMNKELIKLLFGREALTLGEATTRAKSSVMDQDIRKTWILFGDPTTRLKP